MVVLTVDGLVLVLKVVAEVVGLRPSTGVSLQVRVCPKHLVTVDD